MATDFGGREHIFRHTLDDERIRERGKRETAPESTENSREETRALRTVASNNNNKEDHGDNNESNDTTGSGISLP